MKLEIMLMIRFLPESKETDIIQSVDGGIIVSVFSKNPSLFHRLVCSLHSVVYQFKAALFVECLLHILMPSFITLI